MSAWPFCREAIFEDPVYQPIIRTNLATSLRRSVFRIPMPIAVAGSCVWVWYSLQYQCWAFTKSTWITGLENIDPSFVLEFARFEMS